MKVYSIGREVGCDIVINDNTDVISRRHAILNVESSGKMTIVDQSHNGTYVNGIRISPNVPVPVTRKDNVSFAHIARLDWNRVPKPKNVWMYVIIGIVALAIIGAGVWAAISFLGSDNDKDKSPSTEVTVSQTPSDSTQTSTTSGQTTESGPTDQTTQEKKCSTCHKPLSKCHYNGKHPERTCSVCHKRISVCEYGGNHPKQCATCGKPIKECQYGGKHPVEKCATCGKPIKECEFNGKHRTDR